MHKIFGSHHTHVSYRELVIEILTGAEHRGQGHVVAEKLL